jgi:hypothetical protein
MAYRPVLILAYPERISGLKIAFIARDGGLIHVSSLLNPCVKVALTY